jgi:hypothetical protein
LMSEYLYESSRGDSTRGVDIRRMCTGVTVDSRDVIKLDSRDVIDVVEDGERPLEVWLDPTLLPNTSRGLGDMEESRP